MATTTTIITRKIFVKKLLVRGRREFQLACRIPEFSQSQTNSGSLQFASSSFGTQCFGRDDSF
jgi:hypothetical protein